MALKTLCVCVVTATILCIVSLAEPLFKNAFVCILAAASLVWSSVLVRALLAVIVPLLGACVCESQLETLCLYAVASRVRKFKEFFESAAHLRAQTEWINAMKDDYAVIFEELQWQEYAKQRFELLARAPKPADTSQETQTLQETLTRLRSSQKTIRYHEHLLFERCESQPEGARIREFDAFIGRRRRLLERDPKKFMAHLPRVRSCQWLGGCCKRGCGCCLRPRAILPDGRPFYTHCTRFCGCCIHDRQFTMEGPVVKGKALDPIFADVLF